MSDFNEEQIERYARHILLKDVGGEGQKKLLEAKVLVVGAGGLGSPVIMYLAAAGVGTIAIVDDDEVDLSNLQRQIIHGNEAIGEKKVMSAAKRAGSINPDIRLVPVGERLTPENVEELLAPYDFIVDGSDNFETRFLLNDACYFLEKPLISAAILQFDGQVMVFRAYEDDNPCYRCIFREPPPPGLIPSCAEAGVMGTLCGVVGSLQATEVIKEIIGIGDSLDKSLLIYDGLSTTFRKVSVKKDPGCPLCGDNPTITDLTVHGEKQPA